MLLFNGTTELTMNNLVLQDSPFYTLQLTNVQYVHIYDLSIVSRRLQDISHNLVDLSAFNTDGIDIAGHHVHVHDVDIWNQDDCIAVKDNLWEPVQHRSSTNMTFERIHASGLGLTIGSIAGTTVRDIIFRDSYLYKTYKGIYLKFRQGEHYYHEDDEDEDDFQQQQRHSSLIENISYENITMESPLQWAIWIGPAQQTGGLSSNICHASPCSLCWPMIPMQTCQAVSGSSYYRNITLRDITIRNPKGSPGVILGGGDHHQDKNDYDDYENDDKMGYNTPPPIVNLTFHNVQVILDDDDESGNPSSDGGDGGRRRPREPLSKLFPSLSYPVHDPIAQRTVWIAFGIGVVITIAILILTIRCICQCCQQRRQQQHQQRRPTGMTRLSSNEEGYDNDCENEQDVFQDEENDIPDDDDDEEEEDGVMRPSESSSRQRRRRQQQQPRQVPRHVILRVMDCVWEFWIQILCVFIIMFCTMILILATIQFVYWIWLIPKVDSPYKYFVCQGVVGGVATGNTNPVPFCLDDQTTTTTTTNNNNDNNNDNDNHNEKETESSFLSDPILQKQGIVGFLLLVSWSSYTWTVRRLWRRGGRGFFVLLLRCFCCRRRRPCGSRRRRRRDRHNHHRLDDNHNNEEDEQEDNDAMDEYTTTALPRRHAEYEGDDDDEDDEDDDNDNDTRWRQRRRGVVPSRDTFSGAWRGVNQEDNK